jgi:hypothetical protein
MSYSDDIHKFDWKIYLKFNPDLSLSNINNKKKAEDHFYSIGKNENRKHCLSDIIPIDFDWIAYRESNPILNKTLSQKQVVLYYIKHGIFDTSCKNINTSIITSKETFRAECIKQLPILKNIELPSIPINEVFEIVFIECRWYEHIEVLLRNAIMKFPNWSHTVFCGKQNEIIMRECCNFISPNIKVIKLEYDNLTPSEYSKLLTSRSFWEQIHGDTILIHQEDSYIFHNVIDAFLKYDYVGAPWPKTQNDNSYGVGNGGFSLRNKHKMLEVIDTVDPHKLAINSDTLRYIKHTNSTFLPEDVYFSKSLIDYKIGTVANRKLATEFSQETQPSKNPLGGHNFYLANTSCDIDRYIGLKLLHNYYKYVDHRGGWKTVINYGIDNDIISSTKPNNVLFIDCCEKYFLWDKMPVVKGAWIGILHTTNNVPIFLQDLLGLNNTLSVLNFKKSLSTCVGIITLTDYQKKYVEKVFNNKQFSSPKLFSLKHPIAPLTSEFDLNIFKSQPKYNIILLGQQLRKITDILKITKTAIIKDKIWLSGIKNETVRYEVVKKEIVGRNLSENTSNEFFTTVMLPYVDKFEEYDYLIQTSIVVLPLYDAAANNSVLECMISNTPFFVEKTQGTIEYLGIDYPMFFNDICEINIIIADKVQLIDKYQETYDYLTKLDKSQFSYKKFYSEILKIINNIEY